jgi:hypothetical protein
MNQKYTRGNNVISSKFQRLNSLTIPFLLHLIATVFRRVHVLKEENNIGCKTTTMAVIIRKRNAMETIKIWGLRVCYMELF